MSHFRLLSAALAVPGLSLSLGACGVPETGRPPPLDRMYFPVGVAPHPDGRYLYVANAGFDRRYNAGTVEVFDTYTRQVLSDATVQTGLFAGELAVARFRQPHLVVELGGEGALAPDAASAAFTVAVHNEGRGPAVEVALILRLDSVPLSTGGDAVPTLRGPEVRYRILQLAPGDTFEASLTLPCTEAGTCTEIGRRIGASLLLGGVPYATPEGPPSETDLVAAFVTTREDNAVTFFEVDATLGNAPGHLSCGAGAPEASCDETHRLRRLADVTHQPAVGGSPYGLALDSTGFYVSHVKRGELSRWRLATPVGTDTLLPMGECRLALSAGASSVTRNPLTGWAYVSDRFGQLVTTVATLDPLDRGLSGRISTESCRLEEQSPLLIDPDAGDGRTRGLAFSADGTLLYVATGSDASLHVYDTSIGPNGRPRNALIHAIPLGNGPNVVRVAGLRAGEHRAPNGPDLGAVGQAVDARGQGLVYISAFDSEVLLVVDPTLMAVVARIPTGAGPHDITFLPDHTGALQAWVSNFRAHSLTLVDIDPDSPRRFTALAHLP